MSPLTPEEMDDLRKEMATLAISDASKDELIHIIDSIVISFVDQAHGLDPVQLSLADRANKHFQNGGEHANKKQLPKHELDTLERVKSPRDSKLNRRFEP